MIRLEKKKCINNERQKMNPLSIKEKLGVMISKNNKFVRKEEDKMTLEKLFQSILNREFELQEVFEQLQDMVDDNKTKKLVSDLEEKVSKEHKFLQEVKIETYKKDEKIPSFSKEKEECDIPEYDAILEEMAGKRIDHLLSYEEQLRTFYLQVQSKAIDHRTKELFERLAQFKKGQIRGLKELRDVYASVI